jgi:hypothetical protein
MASEIIVNTIKAPTTGANANKVIIPSGHELHASGHVIQIVNTTFTTQYGINTDTGWTEIGSLTITPKFASSKIVITSTNHVYVNTGTANNWHSAHQRLLRNSTELAGDTGSDPYGEGINVSNSSDRFMTYSTFHYVDEPNTTSSTTYKMQFRRKNNDTSSLNINSVAYGRQGMMMIMEIAQ